MKKILSIVFLIAALPSLCWADCDWSLGIKPLTDGGYEYSKVCHEQVGIMKQQNLDLQTAIKADQDALVVADQRTQNWMNTSFKMEDRLQKSDALQKDNNVLYFCLGGLTIIIVAIPIALLTHRN
jgi:hypothetical protein